MDRRRFVAAGALLGAVAPFAGLAHAATDTRDHGAMIADLLRRMNVTEKVGQLVQLAAGRQKTPNSKLDDALLARVRRGDVGSLLNAAGADALHELQRVAIRESRLGIPLLFAMDVIHGYRTIFPVPLALASSWDPATVRAAARVAATESFVAGLHWTFSPMVDIARDPRWGRVVEGAGEDPYLGSEMARAQVLGYQTEDPRNRDAILACAKHFVGYGAAQGGRDYNSAELSDQTLNEVYLPPFHAAAKAGCGTFMTAFNDLGGVPMTANVDLVRHLLRERWGYGGLIVSDWNAIRELIDHGVAADDAQAAVLALKAGLDMDMASESFATTLAASVTADKALLPLLDEAVGHVLLAKARIGLFDDPHRFGDAGREAAEILSPAHRRAARKAAERSIVLLRNEDGLLPLRPGTKVALIGSLADDKSSPLGPWRCRGETGDVVTLKDAMESSDIDVTYHPGVGPRDAQADTIAPAVATAKAADVVVVVVGEDYDYSGEARSYTHIGLPGHQTAMLEALKQTGKPLVVVLMSGRPLAIEAALRGVPAVVQSWFLGIAGGPALVDMLTGKLSPAGRLPIAMPRDTGQLPMTYAERPTGRRAEPDLSKDSSRYHDVAIGPLFAFGHGLGYADFRYSGVAVEPRGDAVRISVTVTNTSDRTAEEVVQLYLRDPVASIARPVKELRGFARVPFEPGQTRSIAFTVRPEQMAIWKRGEWVIEPGRIDCFIGASSADIRASGSFTIARGGNGRDPAAAIPTTVEID
ncbi:glycoside hydrolase family 3 C-terminal domain-containing protein [Sphingomonadaceae bacterium LXI357]|uniref:beta-glucosidase n=1 Tax=Stakelama marina TaxID=2826939 RepID=A0A8T4ID71_9SPHN|nr:glycoside hydrolase family 3 C-terminal domain-containing protein [Stakelama marina]